MGCRKHIISSLVALILVLPAFAQHTAQVSVKKYTQADGLSSYNVRNITEDKNGYIWVGTQFGLNRFDGRIFTSYSKNALPKHRLAGIDVRRLAEDRQRGRLWILPGDRGLNCIDLNTGIVQAGQAALKYESAEEYGMSMLLYGDKLWLGSSTGLRIFNTATNKFEADPPLPEHNSNYDRGAQQIAVDSYGNIWCFYRGYGIIIYKGKDAKVLKRIPLHLVGDHKGMGYLGFAGCVLIGQNDMLLATSQGLRKVSFDQHYNIRIDRSPCKSLPQLNAEAVEAICKTKNGLLIAGHGHLYRFGISLDNYHTLKEPAATAEGDWLGSVRCIYVDSRENIWLGCQQGLACIRGKEDPFQAFYTDTSGRLKLDHVQSMHVLHNGDILAGLRSGIAHIDRRSGKFSVSDPNNLYHHIYEDRAGSTHVARTDGMFLYTNGLLVPITQRYPEFSKYAKSPINSHLFIGDSLVILGTENSSGILVWNYKQRTIKHIDNASTPRLGSNVVNNIYKDKRGNIWVLSDHVVSILSPDMRSVRTLKIHDSTSNTSIDLLFDMCEAGGYYWVTAYGTGLVQLNAQYKVERILNKMAGLSDDGVYQVFPVNDELVVTSDNGLTAFDTKQRSFKRYYREDGLHSNSFEEVAGVMHNGLIYAGGVKGFTIIDPAKFSNNNVAPRVYISRILVDRKQNASDVDTANLSVKTFTVPNDALQTIIYFSGINFSSSERTSFAYRIAENDKEWIYIGNQNYVNLIGLPPGTYQLEVKAANEDGIWSEPTVLQMVYLPKWYQTWWFKALLIVGAIALIYAIYRIRINQLLRQQQIRKDVASDLHDDIGSSLNSVKLFAHLAMTEPSKKEYIQSVEQNLEQATLGLRDMIWVLDDERDTVEDLCDRLSQFAVKAAEAVGINVEFYVAEGTASRKLSKTVKRNFFLVIKEAMNNSVKYAGCKNVLISFAMQGKKLVLTIKDDGRGFDDTTATTGYGLMNMRTRAGQIRYDCSITSGSAGTTITLTEL